MLKRIGAIAALMNVFLVNAYARTISLPEASTMAPKTDGLYDFLFWLSIVSLAGTTIALLMFVVKYHHSKKGRETAYILGNHTAETLWTVIPLILMLGIFAWGFKDYTYFRSDLHDPLEINVIGRQWMWNFEYANGRKTMNELFIPKGRPIKLIMTSEDVIHSFYLPYMRIKQDVVPGMYTYLSFEPTLAGPAPIYCTMYCGTGHSDMLGTAYVLEPEDYQRWIDTGRLPADFKRVSQGAPQEVASAETTSEDTPAARGQKLYNSKGCVACHTVDGTRKVGPSWKGIWGKEEELEGGGKVKVDENYVRESIVDPTAKIVKGYPPSMPPFKGLLSDQEINELIAYIKSLK